MEGTIADVLAGRATFALVHGDCREVAIEAAVVDCTITDPPFNQRTSDNARSNSERVQRPNSDNMIGFIDFAGIDPADFARRFIEATKRWVVAFCAMEQLGAYEKAAAEAWIRASAWYRTNPAPQFTGDRPGQRYEGIGIMHRAGRKRWSRGGECWAPIGPTANGDGKDTKRADVGHPTPKPEWLMIECVDAFTDPGEVVLDPFAGSGTTGVACLRLGRRFIGIERDAKYAAVARERLIAEERGLSLREARAGQSSIFDVLGGSSS